LTFLGIGRGIQLGLVSLFVADQNELVNAQHFLEQAAVNNFVS
jgi:hypothetical protein